MNFTAQRPEFTCDRCGKCCQEEADWDMWLGGPLSPDEKNKTLLPERAKYPENEKGCRMLYFVGKVAHCLVVEKCSDKRDCNCINYPGEKLCLKEKELSND